MREFIKCPRCGNMFEKNMASLCRRDNKTLICSECGTAEGFEDFLKEPYTGEKYWKSENE